MCLSLGVSLCTTTVLDAPCGDCRLLCEMDTRQPHRDLGAPGEASSFSLSSCAPGVELKRLATQKHRQVLPDPTESCSVGTKEQQRGVSHGRAGQHPPGGGRAGSRDFGP